MQNEPALFSPLLAELQHWQAAGKQATLWLRDDDAIDDGPKLQRLIDVCSGVNLSLAIIPKFASKALFERINKSENVWVLQHGWQHVNHAATGEKKSEFGEHRPIETMLDEIAQGWIKLSSVANFRLPIFVPPWNRIKHDLINAIHQTPNIPNKVSVYNSRIKADRNLKINTHVDIINWRDGRSFIGIE